MQISRLNTCNSVIHHQGDWCGFRNGPNHSWFANFHWNATNGIWRDVIVRLAGISASSPMTTRHGLVGLARRDHNWKSRQRIGALIDHFEAINSSCADVVGCMIASGCVRSGPNLVRR